MKNKSLRGLVSATLLFAAILSNAQTDGTLTFSYTPTSHTGYSGTKNVLAVWIQTSSGAFVKTKIRNVGNGTKDHLSTWSVNAGGTSGNALSSSANITDATSGATLTSFTPKSITWDGKNVNGSSNGSTVPDGTYRVAVESCWNHGSTAFAVRYFDFTKGPNSDLQTPADDANFTNITLSWVPAVVDVNENSVAKALIYPNPTNGIFTVDYSYVKEIKVVNMLGEIVYLEKTADFIAGKTRINLSHLSDGVYHVVMDNENGSTVQRVVVQK
jgi:hypothetical protein